MTADPRSSDPVTPAPTPLAAVGAPPGWAYVPGHGWVPVPPELAAAPMPSVAPADQAAPVPPAAPAQVAVPAQPVAPAQVTSAQPVTSDRPVAPAQVAVPAQPVTSAQPVAPAQAVTWGSSSGPVADLPALVPVAGQPGPSAMAIPPSAPPMTYPPATGWGSGPAGQDWTGPTPWVVPAATLTPGPAWGAPAPGNAGPWTQPPMSGWTSVTGPSVAAVAPPQPIPGAPAVADSPTRTRKGSHLTGYGVTLVVAALICAGGVGFAAGRMSSSASSAAGSGSVAAGQLGGFTPGQGFPGGGSTTRAGTADGAGAAGPVASAAPQLASTASTSDAANGASDTVPLEGSSDTGDGSSAAGGPGGFPGGGPGGFGGGFGLTGTVTAVDAGSITIETATGDTQTIVTDTATTYHQEAPATAADVAVGASIRITTSGGMGRGGPGADPTASQAPITATDVLLLEP